MIKCVKVPYETLGEANKAREILAEKGRTLFTYKCHTCKVYHLTSKLRDNKKPIEEQVEINNKLLREQISFKDKLIEQLNRAIDETNERVKSIKANLKLEKQRFYLRSRLEDEFFKDKPELLEEWRQLNIENPFLTAKDFE